MKSVLYIIASFLILAVFSSTDFYRNSSRVEQEWVRRYDFQQAPDAASGIAVDDSGYVYVTGISSAGIFGGYDDYATIKYSPSGVELWVQRYNGIYNGFDWAYSIVVDDSSNVLVTGRADGVYATIKYSPAGIMRWKSEYTATGVSDTNIAYMVKTDRFGNVYVTGTSTGAFGTYRDYATVKYNSSGVQQWATRYNGPVGGYDQASSLAVDDSGNVYVTGVSLGIGTQQTDIATIKYNSSGVQQWAQRYVGAVSHSSNKGNAIALDDSGNVYVTGTGTVTSLNHDYITIKYNSLGVQQWVRGYDGNGAYEEAFAIATDDFANVYVTGESPGSGTTIDFATIKYSSAGVQLWVQRWNGPANYQDYANSLALDSSGNVYVNGVTFWGLNNGDYATVKYTSAGVQEWVQLYNGPANGNDGAGSIAVDKQNNVYITGSSMGNGTGYDYATVKYSQLVGLKPETGELPTEYKLYQNYPNPFNPVTRIKFVVLTPPSPLEGGKRGVTLVIYDVIGREVAVLVDKALNPGTYDIEWDASQYPSGVYFYKLSATGGFSDVKKMVLLK